MIKTGTYEEVVARALSASRSKSVGETDPSRLSRQALVPTLTEG